MIYSLAEMISEILVNLASAFIGVNPKKLNELLRKTRIVQDTKKQQQVLSSKIERLTESLHESSVLMTEIEEEFNKQKLQAAKWQEEADTAKIIAEMHQEEIAAISKVLGVQLEKEGKKSDRKALFWNIFFCVVGILGGYLVSKFFL